MTRTIIQVLKGDGIPTAHDLRLYFARLMLATYAIWAIVLDFDVWQNQPTSVAIRILQIVLWLATLSQLFSRLALVTLLSLEAVSHVIWWTGQGKEASVLNLIGVLNLESPLTLGLMIVLLLPKRLQRPLAAWTAMLVWMHLIVLVTPVRTILFATISQYPGYVMVAIALLGIFGLFITTRFFLDLALVLGFIFFAIQSEMHELSALGLAWFIFAFESKAIPPIVPDQKFPAPVVFFDGFCNLCDSSVNYLMTEDTQSSLRFSPLQGETAKRELNSQQIKDLNTVIVKDQNRVYEKSSAFLKLFPYLGGGHWFGLILYLVPKLIRDGVYDFVARHRYQWFGQSNTCRIPTPEERAQFLD